MAIAKPEWSSLPQDLLAMIGSRLHTGIDTLRFRAVCPSFRSSLPLPPKVLSPNLSLKIPAPLWEGYDYDEYFEYYVDDYGYYLVTESTIYAFESLDEIPDKKSWLLRVEELNSGLVRVDYPLTGWCRENLSMKLPQSLNLLDYRVKEITKAHNFAQVYNDCIRDLDAGCSIERVAVSSCIDEIDDEFIVMVIHDNGQLWCWRNGDKKWTDLSTGLDLKVHDIFYHNDVFYAVDAAGQGITFDVKSMDVTEVAGPVTDQIHRYHCYRLVNSLNDMLLIAHGYDRNGDFYDLSYPTGLKVYKLDEEEGAWVYVVDYLEDRLLFTGDYCSFSVSTKQLSGCEGKCLYYQEREVGADIFYLEDEGSRRAISSDSNILLPPPNLLKHED